MQHPLSHAGDHPEKPALLWIEASGGKRVSYHALMDQALRGARLFRHCGLEPGQGIAVLAEDRLETLAVYWSAQLAGLWYTPVDTRLDKARLHAVLHDCGARLLVTSGAQLDRIADLDYPQPWRFCFDPAPPRFYNWEQAVAGSRNERPDWLCEGAERLYHGLDDGPPVASHERHPGAPLGTPPASAEQLIAAEAIDADTVLFTTLPLDRPDALCAAAATQRVGGTVVVSTVPPAETLGYAADRQPTHSLWDVSAWDALSVHAPGVTALFDPPHRRIIVPRTASAPTGATPNR
jgi:long-chain acyl-CoA synthetase